MLSSSGVAGSGAAGLSGASPISVVVGAEGHATIATAPGHLARDGRRDRRYRRARSDEARLARGALPTGDAPVIVCLQARNINTGASDPTAPAIDLIRSSRPNACLHMTAIRPIFCTDGRIRSIRRRSRRICRVSQDAVSIDGPAHGTDRRDAGRGRRPGSVYRRAQPVGPGRRARCTARLGPSRRPADGVSPPGAGAGSTGARNSFIRECSSGRRPRRGHRPGAGAHRSAGAPARGRPPPLPGRPASRTGRVGARRVGGGHEGLAAPRSRAPCGNAIGPARNVGDRGAVGYRRSRQASPADRRGGALGDCHRGTPGRSWPVGDQARAS